MYNFIGIIALSIKINIKFLNLKQYLKMTKIIKSYNK